MAARKVQTNIKNPQKVEEQRSKIIKAAIQIVIEKGFHETSVREIGSAAGLTQGTLYNYIRSKGDILYLICDEVVSAYVRAVERGIARAPEGMSRVESAVRALVEEVYQQQDLVLLVYRESHKLDQRSLKAVLSRMEQSFVVLEKLLTEASKETPLAVKHMRVAINMLSYFPTLLVMRRWDLERHVSHHEVVDDLVGFMLRGFGFESASAGKQRKARNAGVKAHAAGES